MSPWLSLLALGVIVVGLLFLNFLKMRSICLGGERLAIEEGLGLLLWAQPLVPQLPCPP